MKAESPKPLVFADIDGTVLSEENSYHATKPMMEQILDRGATIIFCSSKTRSEIEFDRKELGVSDPFVSENGGAIFIPKDYFPFSFPFSKETPEYFIVELGTPYSEVRRKLIGVTSAIGIEILGFGDMTANDVAEETGLPLDLAGLAKEREYDEPFKLLNGDHGLMAKALETADLTLTSGSKCFHALGNTNKGKAVTILKTLFARRFDEMRTYGVGDGGNDLSMLDVVDTPLLVRRKLGGRNAYLVIWRNLLSMI